MFSFTGLSCAVALKYLSVAAGRSGVLVNDAGETLCFPSWISFIVYRTLGFDF